MRDAVTRLHEVAGNGTLSRLAKDAGFAAPPSADSSPTRQPADPAGVVITRMGNELLLERGQHLADE